MEMDVNGMTKRKEGNINGLREREGLGKVFWDENEFLAGEKEKGMMRSESGKSNNGVMGGEWEGMGMDLNEVTGVEGGDWQR